MSNQQEEARYVIDLRDLSRSPQKKVAIDEYERIRDARNTMLAGLGLEETYELLVGNYLDFERELLDVGATHMVRSQMATYDQMFHVKHRISRRIVNLLTSTRLFIDQLPHRIKDCCGGVPAPDKLASAMLSEEYDARFGYRFMEAMRNYVQHAGLPVDSMSYGGSYQELKDVSEYTVEIFASRKILRGTTFKAAVRDEMGESVDIKRAIRDYVSGISNTQTNLRNLVVPTVEAAASTLTKVHDDYFQGGKSKPGLSLIKYVGDTEVEYVPVHLEWEKTWRALIDGNKGMTGVDRRYVTNELRPDASKKAPDTSKAV